MINGELVVDNFAGGNYRIGRRILYFGNEKFRGSGGREHGSKINNGKTNM